MPRRAAAESKQKYPRQTKVEKEIAIRHKLSAKNESQRLYISALRSTRITFGAGPAGSGKTYLVMGVALEKLIRGDVERIVITRPVVEAGEHLGYLPGTLEEKIHPYLLPLLDAIEDHVGPTMTKQLMENGRIEIAPLAFMRGRTFNNAYVILDEAQNSTKDQMRMFLTRIGFGSQLAINGDGTQSDLPTHGSAENGLMWAIKKLAGKHENIEVITFSKTDIVRDAIITDILTFLDAPEPKNWSNSQSSTVKGGNGSSRHGSGASILLENTQTQ